jgi:Right handed beta helix region
MRYAIIFTVFLSIPLYGSLPPCYPTQISGPTTISSSGIYNLINDITGTITIMSSNVDLSLCGYTIDASGASYAVNITGTDIVVYNGTVTGASTAGLSIVDGHQIQVKDITAYNNTGDGFVFDAFSDNIQLRNSSTQENSRGIMSAAQDVYIMNVSASGNSSDGFLVNGSNSTITQAAVTSNQGDGIHILSTSLFTIVQSDISGNTLNGLYIQAATSNCQSGLIKYCTIESNEEHGVLLDATASFSVSSISLIGNSVQSNGTTSDHNGITLQSSGSGNVQYNQILINKIINNFTSGISLDSSSNLNQIMNNKILNNGVGITGAFGLDIGGGIFVAGGSGATATTNEVFSNFAKNNGTNAPSITTTNYSNNVQASPASGPPAPNGLVVGPSPGLGGIENISS